MTGLMLGMAVGDALGLPREGLSRRRAQRMFGDRVEPGLVFGRGLFSDDTEHACMTAEALLESDGVDGFTGVLATKLRGWLAAMPPAVGLGTLRALVRLWVGFSPARSGVPSAGNGAAMRAPVIGACIEHARLPAFVRASTRITHVDPRAEAGALAVAIAARHAVSGRCEPGPFFEDVRSHDECEPLLAALELVGARLGRRDTAAELARDLACEDGVTGYVNHTVPICLFAWLRRRDDFRGAIEEVVVLGGDTDTTAAITGALVGATGGVRAIPSQWIDGIRDWPRSVAFVRHLAERLAHEFSGEPSASPNRSSKPERVLAREKGGPSDFTREEPVFLFWPALPFRNFVFFAIVIAIGFRRLLPPY
jgi:ADP-ribosylglycohydrolase